MKKPYIKSSFKLKILNDGTSFYRWEHPWKGWLPLTNQDISSHPFWKGGSNLTDKTDNQTSYIKEFTKKFNKK